MYRFYVEKEQVKEQEITIIGSDVNHIKNVLRMNIKDELILCDGQGTDYYCIITNVSNTDITAQIKDKKETDTELKTKLYLFQGLPKKDKMELIIQKSVELGVYEIIPVVTKRTVVKLDDKKEQKKLERWQSIATSAAKQSGRGMIPKVSGIMSFKEALEYANHLDCNLVPYEKAEGISKTKEIIKELNKYNSIGIFIGPEGGFEEAEIASCINLNMEQVTLGKRILRTETAGLTILSIIMFQLEEDESE